MLIRPVRAMLAIMLCAVLAEPALALPAQTDGALLGRLVGETRRVAVRPGETLITLALRHDIGFVELRAANPDVDVWLPEKAGEILLPAAHIVPLGEGARVVVNRAEMRLYLYEDDGRVWTAPISLGRSGYETPLGRLPVGQKRRDPAWYPTAAHRRENPELPAVVPPGPDNPLGRHAIRLGHTEYLLHGTGRPASIGREVSRGCIRLAPWDAEHLFERVALGDDIRIIDAPVKLALDGGRLYLEIAPSLDQIRALDRGLPLPADPVPHIERLVRDAAGDLASGVDWATVARIARERTGVPEAITPAPAAADKAREVSISSASD